MSRIQAKIHYSAGVSENGWTDDFLCLTWFTDEFIPFAKSRNTSGKPIILTFDGHASHTALDMIEIAEKEGVGLYVLPPHTTHYLQPLDVGVFGHIQRAWANRCDALTNESAMAGGKGFGLTRSNVIPNYLDVRDAVLTEGMIKSAWRSCGLVPLNPTIFGDQNAPAFAPSQLSSIRSHLPPTYPHSMPCVELTLSPGK